MRLPRADALATTSSDCHARWARNDKSSEVHSIRGGLHGGLQCRQWSHYEILPSEVRLVGVRIISFRSILATFKKHRISCRPP